MELPRLRDYEDGDLPALEALWKETGLYRWYNDPETDVARFLQDGNARIVIAERGGKIIGSACVGHDGHRGWVYYLAVTAEERTGGLGKALMRACEDWLVERKIPKIHVMVRASNDAVIAFYERIGYQRDPVGVWRKWLVEHGPAPEGESDGLLDVTITYLEMNAPPSAPPPPKPANVHAALMQVEDPSVPFYRYLYAAVGDDWIWYERRKLSDDALAAIIQDEKVELYVLYVGGAPAGYFEIDRRAENVVDLAFFGLITEYTGLGLGPWLLRQALDIAWSSEPEKITVNTCTLDHPKALGVYQKAGFEAVRRENIRIADPRLTGLVPYTERQVV